MIEILISFVFASAILAFSPGPDNIYVLTQSIVHGKKYGLITILGLMCGCLVHTTLVAFGVSGIIKSNENLFLYIKIIGATYLLFLAYKVYKSNAKIVINTTQEKQKTTTQLFIRGFLMNVLNPKVTIFFLAFFSSIFIFKTNTNSYSVLCFRRFVYFSIIYCI